MHCRFAMLGVAGVLFPELLSGAGLGGPAAAVKWFDAGKFEYFAPASSLFIVQMFLFAWAEIRRCVRYTDVEAVWRRGGQGSGLHSRGPGCWFETWGTGACLTRCLPWMQPRVAATIRTGISNQPSQVLHEEPGLAHASNC